MPTKERSLEQKGLQLMPDETKDDTETTLSGSAFQILAAAEARKA